MKALVLGISLALFALTSCKTTATMPTEPEKQQEMSKENQYPKDQESVFVRGIEIPVFRQATFQLALDAAKLEFGDLYNGYFMWKGDIYNLDGELVNID
jgi:hypothetical protein